MTKYQEYVKRMMEAEKEAFDKFKEIHDAYALDEDHMQEKFNEVGEHIMDIIHEWENKLCKQSEKGGYSQFTPKLAEKFHEEIKKRFPYIDHVGIKVSFAPNQSLAEEPFLLRKIKLN